MKSETAWSELRRILENEGHYHLLETMRRLEKTPEPEFVYRMRHPAGYGKPTVGTKFRMKCLLNAAPYRRGTVVIERSPIGQWTDVTEDFTN